MKHFFFIALSMLLITSCKKGKAELTIKGVLTDQTFNQPLSGASVSLYQKEPGAQDVSLLKQQTVGNDGAYSFTFPRDHVEGYTIIIKKNNYFDIEESISFGNLSIDDPNVYNYSTTAKSWVNLIFKNNAPSSPSDIFKYLVQEGKTGCTTCHPDGYVTLLGEVDTSMIYPNDGNTDFTYYYQVTGTSDNGTKSVNTTAFDTSEIILEY